jgi:hypothetical protein
MNVGLGGVDSKHALPLCPVLFVLGVLDFPDGVGKVGLTPMDRARRLVASELAVRRGCRSSTATVGRCRNLSLSLHSRSGVLVRVALPAFVFVGCCRAGLGLDAK